jgi:hypothetical protein
MDGLEKQNVPKEEESDGQLYKEAVSTKAKFSSNEEAISGLTSELESLAQLAGLSVSELLKRAETSSEFNENEERATSLVRRIAFLRK